MREVEVQIGPRVRERRLPVGPVAEPEGRRVLSEPLPEQQAEEGPPGDVAVSVATEGEAVGSVPLVVREQVAHRAVDGEWQVEESPANEGGFPREALENA